MKRIIFFTVLLLVAQHVSGQTSPWNELYLNTSINPDNYSNGYNYIEFGPNNTLYLLEVEEEASSFGGFWTARVLAYDGSNWNQIGQDLQRNTANNEEHMDFVVSSNGDLFIGMKDSIFQYNAMSSLWESTYIPEYCGGLRADGNGNVYFIHRTEGASGMVYSDLQIAQIDNGSITLVGTIATDTPLLPRWVNTSNKLIFNGSDIYVSLMNQSSNNLFVFKGDLQNGFQKLEQGSATGSSLFTGLGLSSMAVSSTGELLVSNKSATGNVLELRQYDEVNDTWIPFDTTGIHSTSCNYNHLRYDNNGVLHLIYTGSNNTGFLFKYNGQNWEHIGPTSFFSYTTIASLAKPWLAFDNQNTIHFSKGLGYSGVPLQVFGYTETASIQALNPQKSGDLSCYPNPTSEQLTVSHLPQNATIQIVNSIGKLVYESTTQASEITIPTTQLENGWYLLHVTDSNMIKTKAFVVQNP